MLRVRSIAMPAPGGGVGERRGRGGGGGRGRGHPQQSGQNSMALAWPLRHRATHLLLDWGCGVELVSFGAVTTHSSRVVS